MKRRPYEKPVLARQVILQTVTAALSVNSANGSEANGSGGGG